MLRLSKNGKAKYLKAKEGLHLAGQQCETVSTELHSFRGTQGLKKLIG